MNTDVLVSRPFTAKYSVDDLDPFNPKSATEVRRQVFVLNPCGGTLHEDGVTEEIACSKDASGTVSCSRNGILWFRYRDRRSIHCRKHLNHQISRFLVQKNRDQPIRSVQSLR